MNNYKIYLQGGQYMLQTIGVNGVDVVSTPISAPAKKAIEELQRKLSEKQNATIQVRGKSIPISEQVK